LIVLVFVVLGLAAVVTAGLMAVRSGIVSSLLSGTDEDPSPVTIADVGEIAGGGPEQAEPADDGPTHESSPQRSRPGDDAATDAVERTPEPRSQPVSPTPARERVPPPRDDATGAVPAGPAPDAGPAPTPTVAAPPPTATAVLALGDPLLADTAVKVVEERLTAAGVDVMDARSIDGLPLGDDPRAVADTLAPFARWLVVVRGDVVGQREVMVMGRYEVISQGRLFVRLVDLSDATASGPLVNETVEFTPLNVEGKVRPALRPAVRQIVARVR
jgi:hypothetical protein